jgi:hypothetical protein
MRRGGALLLLLLPAACAQPDPADPAQVLQEVLATHQASMAGVGASPAAARAAPPTTAAAPRPASTATSPAAITPAAAPVPGLAPSFAGDLVGLSPEALRQQLGEPRLRREEGTAEIWHYEASQCHLDLVLYPDGPRAGLRVAYAAARAVGTARRGEAACLRDIARGANGLVRNAFAEPA